MCMCVCVCVYVCMSLLCLWHNGPLDTKNRKTSSMTAEDGVKKSCVCSAFGVTKVFELSCDVEWPAALTVLTWAATGVDSSGVRSCCIMKTFQWQVWGGKNLYLSNEGEELGDETLHPLISVFIFNWCVLSAHKPAAVVWLQWRQVSRCEQKTKEEAEGSAWCSGPS